jgi:hypothetical protein
LLIKIFANIAKDFQQHSIRKFAGKRILLAGMVRSKEPGQRGGQLMDGSVTERVCGEIRDVPLLLQ